MNEYFVERPRCPCCTSERCTRLCCVPYEDALMRQYLDGFYSPQGGVEHDYLRNARYILEGCVDCGAIYQREVPSEALAVRLYEKWIDPRKALVLEDAYRDIEYFAGLSAEIHLVLRFFGGHPGSLEFLDFGMGWGHWSLMARAWGCQVTGVDLSPSRMDHAVRAGIRVIAPSDVTHGRYDFINTDQVFEHLPAPLETLISLAAALKPRGVLKISVPNGHDIERRLQRWDWAAPKHSRDSLNAVAPLEHLNCYNHDVLVTMARRAGLRLLHPSGLPVDAHAARTLRAILRPAYHRLRESLLAVCGRKPQPVPKSTYLFFLRNDA